MCIIQCIDCVVCPDLTLVPLKSDYFNGGDYRNFRKWDRLDLVRRFKNSGKIYTQVYDKMCMNPECPRRKPDYKPREGEKINQHVRERSLQGFDVSFGRVSGGRLLL